LVAVSVILVILVDKLIFKMEGRCKAGNWPASVGKTQLNNGTMSTSHGSPPPGTCHAEFTVENKYKYLNTMAYHEPRGMWEGANKS